MARLLCRIYDGRFRATRVAALPEGGVERKGSRSGRGWNAMYGEC